MAKVPDGRSLVEDYAGRPFSLVGVNTDAVAADLERRTAESQINWRSFADGGTDGPITSAWGVSAFPTTFLLDHEGVLRGTDLTGDALRAEIDALLARIEDDF